MRVRLRRVFDNWEKEILRPVLVAVLTASVLFTFSMIFRPVRGFFFPSETTEYPLYCTAETYVRDDSSGPTLVVDFFIINRTGDEVTRDKLQQGLMERNPDPGTTASPDIQLKYTRQIGTIGRVDLDQDFNAGKGELALKNSGTDVRIVPTYFQPRAIMKVSIVVVDLPRSSLVGVTRTSQQALLDFPAIEDYQRACYSR